MKTLNRLLLVLLSVALLVAVYLMHSGTTQLTVGHETLSSIKWPWLHEIREATIFAVLGWCLLFLRRDPTFARIGLAAVILAFAIMNWPFAHAWHLPELPSWH
jgi:hypothetical protein